MGLQGARKSRWPWHISLFWPICKNYNGKNNEIRSIPAALNERFTGFPHHPNFRYFSI